VAREQQVPGEEPAARVEQAVDQCRCHRERRVGHHVERAPGEAEVAGVGLHDRHRRVGEPLAQGAGPAVMQLDGDHARPGGDEGCRERARSGTDVDHEVAGADPRLLDEAPCGVVSEPVPPPARRPGGGDDAPSRP
jgi:hypothetical protein